MKFKHLPEANVTLGKPEGWEEKDCQTITAVGVQDRLGNFFLVAFQPSPEDIFAINAGQPILLRVSAEWFPPVALFTLDPATNEINVDTE